MINKADDSSSNESEKGAIGEGEQIGEQTTTSKREMSKRVSAKAINNQPVAKTSDRRSYDPNRFDFFSESSLFS